MKNLPVTVLLAAFATVLASVGSAASSTTSRPAKGTKPAKPDSAVIVTHLTTEYAKVAPYDLNINGQLEESELEQLADAITAGTVTFTPPPGRTPPADFTPPPEAIAHHIAGMYATVAPYDVNVDGVLSTDEQVTLKAAIDSGKLPGPGGPGGPGPKCPGPKGAKGGSTKSSG